MKKIILTTGIIAVLSVLPAFGQGNFVFQTGPGFVWNTFVNPAVRGGPFNVGFAWSTNSSATPLVVSVEGRSHTPTNSTFWPSPIALSAILADPNFHIAQNAGLGNAIAVGTVNTLTGFMTYNGGSPFGVTGTSTSGGSVKVYFFGWSNFYSDPVAAAAAGSAVGWSEVFTYNYGDTGTAPIQMGNQSIADGVDARFGIGVPEPTTFSLVGLGAAVMLIFRRR